MFQFLHDKEAEWRERSESPQNLNGEETENMYTKHVSVLSRVGQTMPFLYVILIIRNP